MEPKKLESKMQCHKKILSTAILPKKLASKESFCTMDCSENLECKPKPEYSPKAHLNCFQSLLIPAASLQNNKYVDDKENLRNHTNLKYSTVNKIIDLKKDSTPITTKSETGISCGISKQDQTNASSVKAKNRYSKIQIRKAKANLDNGNFTYKVNQVENRSAISNAHKTTNTQSFKTDDRSKVSKTPASTKVNNGRNIEFWKLSKPSNIRNTCSNSKYGVKANKSCVESEIEYASKLNEIYGLTSNESKQFATFSNQKKEDQSSFESEYLNYRTLKRSFNSSEFQTPINKTISNSCLTQSKEVKKEYFDDSTKKFSNTYSHKKLNNSKGTHSYSHYKIEESPQYTGRFSSPIVNYTNKYDILRIFKESCKEANGK